MLKETARSIAPSIAKLFNQSIASGKFPSLWKRARVIPIPKSTDIHSPSGYRPTSLLPALSKLLEKHIHSNILEHLDNNALIADCQWGFQAKKSTVTALLSVTQDWLTALDERKDIHCTFFDLQKAFDKVPHGRLMAKLEQLQLNKPLLKWISSYLLNREQSVVVNGVESEFVQVISGVPQGSVLGPLLFLIYINDVASIKLSVNTNVNTKLSLYADDMLLYKVITSSEDYAELQEDINLIHNWSVNNLMTFQM